uniref:Uncharacterized protein n=1 Tax=Ixodes ricinus TaxID=34613 RepID=A0A6B0UDK0_IXORI
MLAEDRVRVHLVQRRLLILGATYGLSGLLDGIDAAVEPVDALVDAAKLPGPHLTQLQKLRLVARRTGLRRRRDTLKLRKPFLLPVLLILADVGNVQ